MTRIQERVIRALNSKGTPFEDQVASSGSLLLSVATAREGYKRSPRDVSGHCRASGFHK